MTTPKDTTETTSIDTITTKPNEVVVVIKKEEVIKVIGLLRDSD